MGDNREWIPDEAIEALTVRRALQDREDPIKLSNDLIKEALPLVTMSMTHMAIYSGIENTRLAAGKYIMDRALGDGKDLRLPDNKPAWEKIFDSVLVEVESIQKNGE